LLITRDETAEMLGVSGFTLWRWRKNGFLKPLVGAGGRTAAYLRSDVEKIKRTAYLDRLIVWFSFYNRIRGGILFEYVISG
jgi:predicted site-specific integrase-resolvase